MRGGEAMEVSAGSAPGHLLPEAIISVGLTDEPTLLKAPVTSFARMLPGVQRAD